VDADSPVPAPLTAAGLRDLMERINAEHNESSPLAEPRLDDPTVPAEPPAQAGDQESRG
jgi:hypothetical protein